ncbi:MAG TPA: VWA domain-containing protein [Terriglobales bacterium]|nr:VWA domain-containing protein [Terriglobales bacterium]
MAQSKPANGANNQDATSVFEPAQTFRTTTRLVVLDIVAVDGKGEPITDVKAEDIQVTEDGEAQKLIGFSFHRPGALNQKSQQGNIISNSPQYSGNSCLNVILLDAINTDFSNHAYAQDMLIKYLESGPAIQPTAVYALETNLRLLHEFTTDTKALRETLAHYTPPGVAKIPDVYAAASPFERRGTFQPTARGRTAAFNGMIFLAQALAGYPGRKNLIWISEGFPLNLFPDAMMGEGVMVTEDYSAIVEKIADDLMAAQVALYPVSAAGVSQTDQFSATTAMASMAQRTGGKTFVNRNDIDMGVRTSLDDGATYYTAEYYPRNKGWDGKFRHIKVKINRPGVKLTYRDGYYAVSPNTRFGVDSMTQQFSNAMAITAPAATAIRFQAAVFPPSKQTQNKVLVNIGIDPHTLAFQLGNDGLHRAELNCVVWAYPAKGDPVRVEGHTLSAALGADEYAAMMKAYFPCSRTLELKPGRYTLRLGILDRTSSQIGAMSTPLVVP